MGMPQLRKKGFMLWELLLVMMVISLGSSAIYFSMKIPSFEDSLFLQRYLLAQTEAITQRKQTFVGEGISFNKRGNVNQAKTIHFPASLIYIHLGNGSFRYEKT